MLIYREFLWCMISDNKNITERKDQAQKDRVKVKYTDKI